MTFPIAITITATPDDHFRAETPAGPVEASSLRELGDRVRDLALSRQPAEHGRLCADGANFRGTSD